MPTSETTTIKHLHTPHGCL